MLFQGKSLKNVTQIERNVKTSENVVLFCENNKINSLHKTFFFDTRPTQKFFLVHTVSGL